MEKKWFALTILNELMRTDGYLTTTQICSRTGCNRRTVYTAMDMLEINGFGIDIIKEPKSANKYKYVGLYGN